MISRELSPTISLSVVFNIWHIKWLEGIEMEMQSRLGVSRIQQRNVPELLKRIGRVILERPGKDLNKSATWGA